jgi:hypothetical protein
MNFETLKTIETQKGLMYLQVYTPNNFTWYK